MTSVAVKHYPMRIGGADVDSERRMTIVDPGTGETVATVAQGGSAEVDSAVAAAKSTFDAGVWRLKTPQERATVMRQITAAANAVADELVELEMCANGATVRQATGFHIGYALTHFNYFADLAETYAWQRPAPISSFPALGQPVVHREPIGVVGAIAPWNFPLLLTLWKVGPALAAGNSVVVKPDEHTPLSILEFARIAEANGLPPGVLNVVPGDGPEAGARLASHPDVGKIAFTGSTAVGREIMRLASGTVKQVTLELGGKGPSIVLDDADLDMAADGVLYGCFVYSGQVCESGTRALVPADRHDAFVDRLVRRARTIQLGPTRDWDTDMGPVIDGRQQRRILEYIQGAVAEGAQIVLGGEALPQPGFWVSPTILTGVHNDMRIAREEVFGPVLVVIPYTDDDDAVAIANDSEYGLAASIWSGNNARALELAERIQAGSVWINDAHQINCQVPFGGYKQSGLGRELGPDALDAYTEVKTVHLDLSGGRDAKPYDILLSHAD
ncbi:aldehyde dehydrogenase family protein [Mycolicibacterium holsaticum]|uniref:aldehyde dehydrogenase family protein n=1 Tax=Mycolicibacterium holsaticum TaxID=152142 RepID=UPI001C7DBF49|nr:aldehyde dehydrogenase family protein [Mycolicibacterium holsaticum]MDA4108195.1 aldehyde dehydrogenase [Mycolicibacterium holsaticum DSM 44478 = JCM 12374]QZA14400.1 aldehyde dehydrogenase family protein [Mycolicibacterium holsaticum DSM 44478 = JCM 12374]UNC08150.1 aldehyde dehydrogenase [Mycolicibacterium holsaticum DSM 44478 = JCM 12374]